MANNYVIRIYRSDVKSAVKRVSSSDAVLHDRRDSIFIYIRQFSERRQATVIRKSTCLTLCLRIVIVIRNSRKLQ